MSNQQKSKLELRHLMSNKKSKIKSIFSSNPLGSINKETTEKKMSNDLSLNFLKNYSTTSLTNKTCINHNHKKIVIKEKLRLNNNRKIALNMNHHHNKHIKFPLKLNYKQSISLKNLGEEENINNAHLRLSDKRKNNNNTKIELFSTNSTLSFLNIKDNNKENSKPIKIKCFNYNHNNNINTRKKFSATLIERKLMQKSKSNSKIKIKHIKNNLSLDKNIKINLQKNHKNNFLKENIFNNSNKSIEFGLTYMKPINKRRNLSIGINESSNSNTNSIKELYNKKFKQNNLNSSNMLFDNISFSLNKNQTNDNGNWNRRGLSFSKKINLNTYYKPSTINNNSNKKFNLSSLPNLLFNNYLNKNNYTLSTNDLFNNREKGQNISKYNSKKKNSFQNLFETKKMKKNIKLKKINHKGYKTNLFLKKEEDKKNSYNENSDNTINNQLQHIHCGIKSLLDGIYSIYLNASKIKNNHNQNIN